MTCNFLGSYIGRAIFLEHTNIISKHTNIELKLRGRRRNDERKERWEGGKEGRWTLLIFIKLYVVMFPANDVVALYNYLYLNTYGIFGKEVLY